jgi:hypothetical protein
MNISTQAYYQQRQRDRQKALYNQQVLDWVQTERLVQPRLGTRKLQHLMQQQQLRMGLDKLFDWKIVGYHVHDSLRTDDVILA